jgi:hypothetical protein
MYGEIQFYEILISGLQQQRESPVGFIQKVRPYSSLILVARGAMVQALGLTYRIIGNIKSFLWCELGPKSSIVVPTPFSPVSILGGVERGAFELAKLMASRVPTGLFLFGAMNRGKVYGFGPEKMILGVPWHVRGQCPNRFHSGILRHI